MKAATKLKSARPNYSPALVALAAIHEPHGAFLGGNFVDCAACRFHAHNREDGRAEEHTPDYSHRVTYEVKDGELVIVERYDRPPSPTRATYSELHDALTALLSLAEARLPRQWREYGPNETGHPIVEARRLLGGGS